MKGVILCRGYGLDSSVRRFWSGRRWVVDPSDAWLYTGRPSEWQRELERLRLGNTTDREIVAVLDYGYNDEAVIKGIRV